MIDEMRQRKRARSPMTVWGRAEKGRLCGLIFVMATRDRKVCFLDLVQAPGHSAGGGEAAGGRAGWEGVGLARAGVLAGRAVSLRCSTAHRVQRRQSCAPHMVNEQPEDFQTGPMLQCHWRVALPLNGRFTLRLCDLHPRLSRLSHLSHLPLRRRGAGTHTRTHTQYLANLYRSLRSHQLPSPDLTDFTHLTCHGLVADAMLSHANIEGTLDIVCFLFKPCAANPTPAYKQPSHTC